MKAVKIQADGSIKLPKDILRMFPPASEVAVSWEGDTIMLGNGKGARLLFWLAGGWW